MTKTSTPNNLVSSPNTQPLEKVAVEAEQQDELFYNSIKPQLNKLVKDPSEETIAKILAYSKSK
ncbi:hypothetical protein FA048_12235 [Pedobacter polaris]|uniref:Uncharacterized protein n=1 Tax=Pedobacter polaris TaxID=2571273 RepID=A0A4U1CL17_9SPHI|nr:hypothetical protein [Pedobacter polaris]TKC07927.1 hypothetical protein FA048_12235 [Pedobacter polaris]